MVPARAHEGTEIAPRKYRISLLTCKNDNISAVCLASGWVDRTAGAGSERIRGEPAPKADPVRMWEREQRADAPADTGGPVGSALESAVEVAIGAAVAVAAVTLRQRRGRWPNTYTGSPVFVTCHKLAALGTVMVTQPSEPGGDASGFKVPCSAMPRSKNWLYGIG